MPCVPASTLGVPLGGELCAAVRLPRGELAATPLTASYPVHTAWSRCRKELEDGQEAVAAPGGGQLPGASSWPSHSQIRLPPSGSGGPRAPFWAALPGEGAGTGRRSPPFLSGTSFESQLLSEASGLSTWITCHHRPPLATWSCHAFTCLIFVRVFITVGNCGVRWFIYTSWVSPAERQLRETEGGLRLATARAQVPGSAPGPADVCGANEGARQDAVSTGPRDGVLPTRLLLAGCGREWASLRWSPRTCGVCRGPMGCGRS